MKLRLLWILALAVASAFAAQPVRAGTLPAGARVRAERATDLPAFQRSVFRRYHVLFHRVVAADIDRDGDLDVIGATERGLVVWVNDGKGHLTSAPTMSRRPALEQLPALPTWSEDSIRCEESIQNELPSHRLPESYAHGPPLTTAEYDLASLDTLHSTAAVGCRTPRAPPL